MERIRIKFLLLLIALGTSHLSWAQCGSGSPTDCDGDGISNSLDLDDDNDGILDSLERLQITIFSSNEPLILRTDGRLAGFRTLSGGTLFDTFDGWTWYTQRSTVNDSLVIPFGSGTDTIGEQGVRVGGNLELAPSNFHFGFGFTNIPNALRSQVYRVIAGSVNVTWTGSNLSRLKSYYSVDGGASWANLTNGSNFIIAVDSVEFVFVGNDGNDSNSRIDTVWVTADFDTDHDGIADYQDLDSDGDGCSDANEAYNDTNADGGDGGIYGTGIPTFSNGDVNANGLVIAAGLNSSGNDYTNLPHTTNSNSGSKKAHLQGINLSLAAPFSDQTATAGNTATFTAELNPVLVETSPPTIASSDIPYNWQLSTDGGNTFNDIAGTTDTLTTGTTVSYTTPTLTVADTNHIYKVIFNHEANVCGLEIEAALNLLSNAGQDGSFIICKNGTVTADQLYWALGEPKTSGGSWSPALAGAGTYTYTIINGAGAVETAEVLVVESTGVNCTPCDTTFYVSDPLVSGYHSTIAKTTTGFLAFGENMDPTDGNSHLLSPTEIIPDNGFNYTGHPRLAGLGQSIHNLNSPNAYQTQNFLLTSTNLYVWGHEGTIVPSGLTSSKLFQAINLPEGISPDDVKYMTAAPGALALQTKSGDLYIIATTNIAVVTGGGYMYGDGSTIVDTLWHKANVPEPVLMLKMNKQAVFVYTTAGKYYTWGSRIWNSNGMNRVSSSVPVEMLAPFTGTPSMLAIGSSNGFSGNARYEDATSYFALNPSDSTIYVLGDNNMGQLAQNNFSNRANWAQVLDSSGTAPLNKVVFINSVDNGNRGRISAGAITSDLDLYLWGCNNYGMIGGDRDVEYFTLPIIPLNFVKGQTAPTYVETGGHTTIYVDGATASYFYVGHKRDGSVGDGTSDDVPYIVYGSEPNVLGVDNICTDRYSNLSIEKTVNNINPVPNETVSFSIEVTLHGDEEYTGIAIDDVVPSGYSNISTISHGGMLTANTISWTGLNLSAGSTITLSYQAKVNEPTGAVDEFKNLVELVAVNQLTDFNSAPNNDDGDQSEDDEDSLVVDLLIDTDGDLVADIYDFDDDNDGILDSLESCGIASSPLSRAIQIYVQFDNDPDAVRWELTDPDGTIIYDSQFGDYQWMLDGMGGWVLPGPITIDTSTIPKAGDYVFRFYHLFGGFYGGDPDYKVRLDGNDVVAYDPNHAIVFLYPAPSYWEHTFQIPYSTHFNCLTNDPSLDSDDDGIVNYKDPDFCTLNTAGVCTILDADLDGLPDHMDLDTDNDGIADIVEAGGVDTDGNGLIDLIHANGTLIADSDNDGVADVYDPNNGGTIINNPDTDGDGIFDTEDIDADNDGIADIVEAGGQDNNEDGRADNSNDTDGDGFVDSFDQDNGGTSLSVGDEDLDGIANYLDLDSDNDGLTDNVEGQTTAAFVSPLNTDTDGDGWDDRYDSDNGGAAIVLSNNESAANADYLDLDSDGDGQNDWQEGFNDDENIEEDALNDLLTRADNFETQAGNPLYYVNTDDADFDGIPDWLEDDDGDQFPNFLDPDHSDYHDTDNDGLIDLYDPNNYGLASTLPDSDGDGEYDFRDSDDPITLPIQLLRFYAFQEEDRVRLEWTTLAEINNDYFTVEKLNGKNQFTPLIRQEGSGNSQGRIEYKAYDQQAWKGSNYYRLRQTDFDGKSTVTEAIHVYFEKIGTDIRVNLYPNPTNGSLLILELNELKEGYYHLEMYSIVGQLMHKSRLKVERDKLPLSLNLIREKPLSKGVYLMHIKGENFQLSKKIFVK